MPMLDKTNPDYVYLPIVHAIQKAVTFELPSITSGLDLATSNYKIYLRGDVINTTLRDLTLGDDQFFIRFFKRSGWDAGLLFDTIYKRIFFITTDSTFESYGYRKKDYPHFSYTLVKNLNSDLEGKYYTGALFDDFTPGLYAYDMNYLGESFQSLGINIDGYHFYYITYTVASGVISKIRSLLLNGEFNEVEDRNLIDFLDVDYGSTPVEATAPAEESDIVEDSRNLVKLKEVKLPQSVNID